MDPKNFVDYDPALGLMPREPQDVFSDKVSFALPMSFGEFEMENVARDFLMRQFLAHKWVGMSWPRMITVHAGTPSWWTRLWNNLRKVPPLPQKTSSQEVDIAIVHSGRISIQETRINGAPLSLLTGVRHLEKEGFVAINEINGCDYIFPTPKLIEKYLEHRRYWEEQHIAKPAN